MKTVPLLFLTMSIATTSPSLSALENMSDRAWPVVGNNPVIASDAEAAKAIDSLLAEPMAKALIAADDELTKVTLPLFEKSLKRKIGVNRLPLIYVMLKPQWLYKSTQSGAGHPFIRATYTVQSADEKGASTSEIQHAFLAVSESSFSGGVFQTQTESVDAEYLEALTSKTIFTYWGSAYQLLPEDTTAVQFGIIHAGEVTYLSDGQIQRLTKRVISKLYLETPVTQTVSVEFDRLPIPDALRMLAEMGGVNMVSSTQPKTGSEAVPLVTIKEVDKSINAIVSDVSSSTGWTCSFDGIEPLGSFRATSIMKIFDSLQNPANIIFGIEEIDPPACSANLRTIFEDLRSAARSPLPTLIVKPPSLTK